MGNTILYNTASNLALAINYEIMGPHNDKFMTRQDAATVRINEEAFIRVGDTVICVTDDTDLTCADLDAGVAFANSTEYFIYACHPLAGSDPVFKISENATYPAGGWDADTSRKIGGFETDGAGDITVGTLWDLRTEDATLVSSATTGSEGLVELATEAEAEDGSDTERAITPATLQAVIDDQLLKSVMTESEFEALAAKRRQDAGGSGFVEFGKHLATENNINAGMWDYVAAATRLFLGRNSGSGDSLTDWPVINVNGYLLRLSAVNDSSIYQNKIYLSAAPTTIADRQNLIFLEAWHELISDLDFFYPYGNVQFGDTTYDTPDGTEITCAAGAFTGYGTYSLFGNWQSSEDLVGKGAVWSGLTDAEKASIVADPQNNIYVNDDGNLVQVRYRVRVVVATAAGSWARAGFTNYLAFAATTGAVVAKGQQTSIAADLGAIATCGYFDDYANTNIDDFSTIGAWTAVTTAGEKNTTAAFNGRCFALPIAIVNQRNQGAYHPAYNPNGAAKLDVDSTPTAKYWYESSEYIEAADPATVTLNGTISDGGWVIFYDTDTDTETWYQNTSGGDLSGAQDLTGANWTAGNSFASLANCVTHATGGAIADAVSGRPDGLYYDEINERDVQDLRNESRPVTDLARRLTKEVNRAIAGEIRGWEGEWEIVEVGDMDDNAESLETDFGETSTTLRHNVEIGAVFGVATYIDDSIKIFIEGNSNWYACIYKKHSSGYTYFYLHPKHGDVRSDFTGSNTYKYVVAQRRDRPRKTLLHCDIIGDPANYPALFADIGFAGVPLIVSETGASLLPDGSTKDFKASRKFADIKMVLIYDSSAGTFTRDSGPEGTTAQADNLVNLTANLPADDLALVFYECEGNPYALADNAEVLNPDQALALNHHVTQFVSHLITKVGAGAAGQPYVQQGKKVEDYSRYTTDGIFDASSSYRPVHSAFTLSAQAPAAKGLPYLTRENNQLYLQFIFKEMRYTSAAWQDDEKFDITDDNTTTTDDDGNVILVGQKRVALPAFVRDDC